VHFGLIALLSAAALFLGMLLFSEIGRRIGLARLARDSEGLTKGAATAEAAVFGLLGLLIAFTFSGAASRFEDRRHLIADETNAIGTAYLRLDILPPDAQPQLRELFRHYTDVRATVYHNAADQALTKARLDEGAALQGEIWRTALAALQQPGTPPQAITFVLAALNEMFDITETREAATRNHPPLIVFLLLSGLSLMGALLVGYGTSTSVHRSWLHTVTYAAILSLTVYVIADLEFPRLGLIRVDTADQPLVELRQSMQ